MFPLSIRELYLEGTRTLCYISWYKPMLKSQQLQLANDRSAALEAEVAKLKPILLMVPSGTRPCVPFAIVD